MAKLLNLALACILVLVSFCIQDPAWAQSTTGCSGKLRVATGIAPGVAEELGEGVWQGAETMLYQFVAAQEGKCGADIKYVPGLSQRLTQLSQGAFDIAGGMITPSLERSETYGVDFLVYDMSGSAIISKRGANGWKILWSLFRLDSWTSFIAQNWVLLLIVGMMLLGVRFAETDMLKRAQSDSKRGRKRRSLYSLGVQLLVESATTQGFGWLAPRTLLGSLLCTCAFLFLVTVGVSNVLEIFQTPYVSLPEELRSQDVVVIQGSVQETQAKEFGAIIHPAASLAELRKLFDAPEIDAALVDSPLVKGLKFGPSRFVSTNFFGDSAGVGLALSRSLPVPPSRLWLNFLAAEGEAGKLSLSFYENLNGK